jgi:serine/threonine-protein kinase RsbW
MHWYGRASRHLATTVELGQDENAQSLRLQTWADMRPVFDELEDWMNVLGYPHRDVFALVLAVQEAATNAFRHGNRGDPTKTVWVRYLVTSAEVLVEVEDQGPGFDLDTVPDPLAEVNLDRPSGRGLMLMQFYSSWVSFNARGNRVTLCRQRTDL